MAPKAAKKNTKRAAKAAEPKAPAKLKSQAPKKARRPDLEQEALLWKQGSAFVFGVDEAGRGCLAGPVCAAVSCWAPFSKAFGYPVDVHDSKLMTLEEREAAFGPIQAQCFAFGVGFASAQEIDRWNIFRATHLAVARALEQGLRTLVAAGCWQPQIPGAFAFLTDGNFDMVTRSAFFVNDAPHGHEFPLLRTVLAGAFRELPVVKGDSKVFSIASASVLAKVSRDRHMGALAAAHPAYEFQQHKGYSTPRHMEILRQEGPCIEHRRTFAPVSQSLSLFE